MQDKDITFIRHAESELNIASHNFRVENNVEYDWSILSTMPGFMEGIRYNPIHIDCSITQKGQQQCLKAKQIADKLDFDVILVSPLQRTLQTCNLIFGNRDIPIIVEPVIAQALRSSCDISSELKGKVQRFPKYNFEKVLQQGDLWFINNDSEQNQQLYRKLIEENKPENHQQTTKLMCKYMLETLTFQTPLNVRRRAKKIKETLLEYQKKYKRIGIVAHYNTINFSICRGFDENNQPIDCERVTNCQVYQDSLQQMMKIE